MILSGKVMPEISKSCRCQIFRPLIVAALWRKNLSPSNAAFLAQIRRRAQEVERQILE